MLYYKDERIEKNLEKEKAAKNRNIKVQNNFAFLYKNGKGTEKNLEKVFYWYQKAAENGDIDANRRLFLNFFQFL